jgi:hypothetical protein
MGVEHSVTVNEDSLDVHGRGEAREFTPSLGGADAECPPDTLKARA